MTLEIYAQHFSNCLLFNESWDIYTATFKLLSFKWLLRYKHRNIQTAFFLMTLEIYALQLSNCLLLNDSWDICVPQLSNCFLVNDSWEICTATFKLLPCKWLLRYMYTATFKLLSFKWLLRDLHCNFQTASL